MESQRWCKETFRRSQRMEINETIFYSNEFYRLQKIENLYETGKIDKDVGGKSDKPLKTIINSHKKM